MKRLIITSIAVALVYPTILFASHQKKHTSSTPNTNQPNLRGRVVHGAHAVGAKVTVTARGHHHGAHPHVSSAGQFAMHLKPGTYTAWAKRRGAGKGHVSFHLDQGQALNLTIPIFHHHRLVGRHQPHHLGVAHRATQQTTTKKPGPAEQTITVPTAVKPTGRNTAH